MNKKLSIPLILLSACALTGCGRTEINVGDYLTTEVKGYEGGGIVTAEVDAGNLVADNYEAFGLKEDDSTLEFSKIVADVNSNLKGSLDRAESLSNGDQVTYTWDKTGLESLEKSYKIKLIADEVQIDIADLPEIQDFDPFDYVTIEYEKDWMDNMNPKAVIDESCPVPELLVGFAGENGYQAGETITATISAIAPKDWYEEGHTESEWVEPYCLQYGMHCIQTEKEYVIPKS